MVKQERAARTQRALIHAAAEVFAEVGFVPASLGTISARAGVSNGALHFHFANKSVLAEAVEAEAVEKVRRLAETAVARHGDSLQAVVDAMHALIGSLADDVVVRAGFGLACDIGRSQSPLRQEWQRWVEERLQRSERAGALATGVSWEDAARLVVAVTVGLEVLGGKDSSWLAGQNVTRFWELLLPPLTGGRGQGTLAPAGRRSTKAASPAVPPEPARPDVQRPSAV